MYEVRENYLSLEAGDVVYDCKYHDYGVSSDDTRMLREECISVTKDPEGGYPFTSIPVRLLKPHE